MDNLKATGMLIVEHRRKGELIGKYKFSNGITDAGLNKILDVMFHDATKITPWYIGLIDNAGFTALAVADTMGSHAGWVECVAYDEATRIEWTEGAAAGKVITNASPVDFTISDTKTIYGLFITSDSDKSGTTGTLWSTAALTVPVAVADDDVLSVTYSVTAA